VVLATVVIALLSVVNLATLALGAFALAPLVGGLNPPILSVAIGAAILRYRLYDLDRIISRTLAYGLLTVLLGGGYAAVVLGLGQLFGRDSSLVVAGATLRWPRRSSRPAAASNEWSTGVSTGAATTPPRRLPRSARGCASRSIWTP
jgi:hypothetical protein